MKNIYLSIIGVLVMLNLNAQITLTSTSSTQQCGNSFNYVVIQSPSFNVTQSGANQVWDFSSATGTSVEFNYVLLSNSSLPSTYPLTDVVETSSGTENYFSKSTSDYSLEGQYLPGIAKIIYTDKREFLKFPISYNDVFEETFSGTIENLTYNQTFDRAGTIEIKADGYGDLILPYATVDNVLRVRSVYDYSDTFYGSEMFTYSDTIYTWYNLDVNSQIASKSVGYLNGGLYISGATYMEESSLVTGFEEFNNDEKLISVYPNPANDYISISNANKVLSINIHDIKGVLVKSINGESASKQINISDLSSGLYLIKYSTNNCSYIEKLIIE